MNWLAVLSVVTLSQGARLTDTSKSSESGLSKYWTEDYKVIEQIYGRTSDKDLYGETLPPISVHGINNNEFNKEASEKKERFVVNRDQNEFDSDSNASFDDYYTNYLAKQALNIYEMPKTTSSPFKFITYSDFKPISKTTDPEMYNYYNNLEQLEKQKIALSQSVGGFKPYVVNSEINPQDSEAYKSIQDILDAHETKKVKKVSQENKNKYINYNIKNRRKKPARFVRNNISKTRCLSSRCWKRTSNSMRVRTRPYRKYHNKK